MEGARIEIVLLISCFVVYMVNGEVIKGSVPLNSGTFDKLVPKFKAALIKFDEMYPYGDKHNEYKLLAEASISQPDLLVGEVNIADWGDKENSDLSQRYGVTKEDFPTIKLIVGGKISEPIDFKGKFEQNELKNFIGKHADYGQKDNTDLAERFGVKVTDDYKDHPVIKLFVPDRDGPIDYDGDYSLDSLRKFVATEGVSGGDQNHVLAKRYGVDKDKLKDDPEYKLFLQGEESPLNYSADRYTGSVNYDGLRTFLARKGGLWLGLPACIEEFDNLARDFFQASEEDRKVIHQTALDKAMGIEDENEKERALFYAKTMEKIMENGYDFLQTELKRVTKLSEGKLSDLKKKQLNDRVNILTSFKLRLKDEL